MKKRIIAGLTGLLFLLHTTLVMATGFPFQPNQVLNAADLNNALQSAAITSGTIDSVTITNSTIRTTIGTFTSLTSPSVSLTGGLIDNISIGTVTPMPGTFSTLNATGAFGASSVNVTGNVTVGGTTVTANSATVAASAVNVTNGLTAGSANVTGTATASAVNVTNAVNAATINAGSGVNAAGAYTAAYTDGTVVDYATGNGRISVGANDTLSIYGGGVATNFIAYFTNQTANNNSFVVNPTTISTSTTQAGINSVPVFNANATTTGAAVQASVGTVNSAFTMSNAIAFYASGNIKGAGATVTSSFGFYSGDQTAGSLNYGYFSGVTAGANKWGFYNNGNADNNLGTGTTLAGTLSAISGVLSTGTYTNSFTDGIVTDYATGNGRISVGAADTVTIYNSGVANTQLAQIGSSGVTSSAFRLGSSGTGTLLVSSTAPTIGSGFGTSPSITASNGTAAFIVNVGTGGVATSGTVNLPAAPNGWSCMVAPVSAVQVNAQSYSYPNTTTSVNLQNYTISTGAGVAWPSGYILHVNCTPY